MAIDQQKAKNNLFGNFTKGKAKEQEKNVSKKASQQVSNSLPSIVLQETDEDFDSSHSPQKVIIPKDSVLPQPGKIDDLERFFVRMTCDQRDALDNLSKRLMRFRPKPGQYQGERERITANCIMRALVDNFMKRYHLLDIEPIMTEKDLHEWVSQLFRH